MLLRQEEENHWEKLINDQLRVAFALEHYVAHITSGIRHGGSSEPDLVYYEALKPIGPGEVKITQTKSNKIRFYIYSKNDNHHSLNPSFKFCRKNQMKRFPLYYYWPKWGQQVMMIPVIMPDYQNNSIEYSFLVEKENYQEYVKNFVEFNKFIF